MSAPDVAGPHRHIWLCADDYGISHSVNTAIRDLIMRGRINATSVMVTAPHFDRADAASLKVLNADMPRVAIGLHLTLTAPFRPLSQGFQPQRDDAFLPLNLTMRAAMWRRFRHEKLAIEIATQLHSFVTAFGRPPDFVDGHQHVHLFPQIRDAVLNVVSEVAPNAWVRQCGRISRWGGLLDRKGLLLDLLSHRFRHHARKLGVRTNPAFAGTYDFKPDADIARLFPAFLKRLPESSVVMCHPGFVDAELKRLDPLTTLREREYAYFNSEAFPAVLAAHGLTLA